MVDVDCPYCGEPQEINHDDGYGYDEDTIHQQLCCGCDKNFTFQTSTHFNYEVAEADCLNGSDHTYQQTFTYPVEYTKMECSTCGDMRNLTDTEMTNLMAERKATG